MAQVPFSQVVEILEAAGYAIHHRTKYAEEDDAYFYFFAHRSGNFPGIGFQVRAKMVQGRYYEMILDALKGARPNEIEEEDDV